MSRSANAEGLSRASGETALDDVDLTLFVAYPAFAAVCGTSPVMTAMTTPTRTLRAILIVRCLVRISITSPQHSESCGAASSSYNDNMSYSSRVVIAGLAGYINENTEAGYELDVGELTLIVPYPRLRCQVRNRYQSGGQRAIWVVTRCLRHGQSERWAHRRNLLGGRGWALSW